MIKRFLSFNKYIMLPVKISTKTLYIQKIQIPKQPNLNKTYYNFCQNNKIFLEDGLDHIKDIKESITALNDLQEVFNNQLKIVEYLEDNLQNFDDNIMNIVYIEEMFILHQYQVTIYAYLKQQNPLNSKFTQKLMNCDLMKELDIINVQQLVEPQNMEYMKIQLKAASIMCHMINYGVEADINQLHDWMNDYLDQIEMLDKITSTNPHIFDEINYCYMRFYFLIAQIHRKRNLIEEFERFIDQGIKELKSIAEQIIKMPGAQFELDLILVNIFELFVNFRQAEDIKSDYTINFAIQIVDMISNYWKDQCEIYMIDMKLSFAQYFVSLELFEKAAKLLQEAYDVTTVIVEDTKLFLLYSNIYFCQKEGLLKQIDINNVINKVDNLKLLNLDFQIIQVLDLHMCIFNDILDTKDLEKIKERFEKVIFYIQELSKLIKEKKVKGQIPIFLWIDTVMTSSLLKNNIQFILPIYNALSKFKDIELDLDRQNLEKDFYLIVLSFYFTDKINLNSQQKVKNVEKFAIKYINNQEMQDIALNKLLLLNFQLIEEGKLKECQDIIDSLIEILSKGKNNYNKFIQQFQNQKTKILRIKKHQ